MYWQELKELIQQLPEQEKGKKKGEAFEKLIANLLELLLEKPFVVAKSGTQQRGDARSVDGAIAIQAKNYSHKSNLRPAEVVGDLQIILNNLQDLEVYVLAVSRDISEQLLNELQKLEKYNGVDIVTLQLKDELSELGILCITFWEEICHFFDLSNSNQEFLKWIEEMKIDSEIVKKLEELKSKLEHGILTQTDFQTEAKEKCLICIGDKPNPNPRSSCLIDLSKAKDRPILESKLDNWWEKTHKPICYLEGIKDSGKTWLAANWVKSIINDRNVVPIWLESNQWNEIQSLDDLIYACFKSIYGLETNKKITKLEHKFSYSWDIPTLIILDGLTKFEANSHIETILYDYFEERRIGKTKWGHKILLLITTLNFDIPPNSEDFPWKGCYCIQVKPLSDTDSNITPKSVEHGSTHLAILWTNLLERIENTDSQIRVDFGWNESDKAPAILARLAKLSKWTIVDSANHLSAQLLKRSFSNYQETRLKLEDKRVAFEADDIHVEVSKDHVILGWALYLSHLFESWEFTTIKDFTDRFHHELESFLTEDLITEALFIVLQITAVFPKHLQASLSEKRSALLLFLFNCPNPVLTQERLLFWAEQDTEAYVQFFQSAFKKQILPYEEEAIIEPLSHTWYHKSGQVESIASCLTNWLFQTDIREIGEKVENVNHEQDSFPTMYNTQNRLSAAALSILSQRPERQFLRSLAKCYENSGANVQFKQDIGRLMRWGYTESTLDDLHWLPELTEQNSDLLTGIQGLATELRLANLPILLQRPLSEEDKKWREAAEQWKSTFKPFIDRICAKEKLLKNDSPDTNVNGNYHGLDYLAVRTDLPDLSDEDYVKIREVLQHISENTKLGSHVGATREDNFIQNLMPWIAKYDAEDYAELACNLKINTLPQEWAQFKLLSIQGIIFKPEDCNRITEAILGIREQLAQGEDFYSDVAWLTHLLTETLLFCASEEILKDWFIFLASQEHLRSSICYETLPYLFKYLLPTSIVELAQKKLEEHRDLSHENQNTSDQSSKEFSEEEYWCTLFAYASKVEDKTVKYAIEDLKTRKPDSTGSFPMLRLAYSDTKQLLDETLIDENIQKHLFSENGKRYTIRTYEGNDVPSYELLRSFIPPEFIGSFLSGTDRYTDLSRWGKDFMKSVFSILNGNEGDSNSVKENQFGINREVFQAWAEQNQSDFLHLSEKYLAELSKSPLYQQVLSDITDVIHCLLLRFQPQKAEEIYQQWSSEIVRIIYYDQHGIESFLAQLWKVDQCNTPKHIELRRNLLEEYNNDEEVMFMTIAALTGGGKEELLNLVTQVYLNSHYAKVRNLGVSILPWFGSDEVIELLDKLKSDDHSLWVREHAAWAYEVAQQERSCRTVYREALQTRDLFQISAAFERMKPALSPTARWWPCQIEEDLGLNSELQAIDPKLIALVDRFWYRWGNSSKARRDIEIFGRKLKEYCRGEKNGYFSPPRLAPWWKPT